MSTQKDSLRLQQQQKLHQSLSPLQVQFVRALEMTGPEMEEEVRRELDENPALEEAPEHQNEELPAQDEFKESAEELQMADYRSEDDIPSYRLGISNRSADDPYYEPEAVDGGNSLMEHIISQLAQMHLSADDMVIARLIAGNIDDNGYMTRSLQSITDDAAIQWGIDTTYERVKEIWRMIRRCDPSGVGAVDLRDCLLLQLDMKPAGKSRDVAREMLTHYFDLFSRMRFRELRRAIKASSDTFDEALALIRTLNPKPGTVVTGNTFADDDRTAHITPDFIVENEGGNLTLLMPSHIPHLQVEQTFVNAEVELRPRTRRDEEAAAFVRSKRAEAENFIRVVSMRRETLLRVMTAIMKLQRDFFLTDDELQLRPMILRDVSAATGLDISVVSRATSGKYVATGKGIYPLKFFFNERPKDDSDTSSLEITDALTRLISSEDKNAPMSDEALTAALRKQGYDIARRTVAKYRERAGIPVARLRHFS